MLIIKEAPENIKKLVEKFKQNIESYKSTSYNETTVRQEFIDPLFIALGWDVNNEQDTAPQYRDVILEDSIKVGGKTKAPDYSFTLHGRRMFFVEAKKPSVNIAKDKNPAHQLRRYAWSAKLALSVLTDFEELAIYESKTRPSNKDNVSTGRVALYKYTDYIEKWDEIYNILSKEAVLKGSFDKYAKSTGKKGTSEVDDEFLKEIENWRIILAKNIALRNKELSVEDLNYAVQQTIDRIIFLRMAEDRGVEPYQKLLKILEKPDIYAEFGKLCIKADAKYNSGLFHFKEEKNISQPADTFTLKLKIDDGVFKEIIKNLYYPLSPYEFSVLSPEILGNVYEQFLGKIIRLTPSHQAKIEEKPEVKKAGGVYYTPQYIVDYIVENTVGKICKGKTPKQVAKIRILDPACGSGSFLLGAYNYLLKWHIDYYSKLTKHPKNTIYQGNGGEYFLTIQKKKEILLNNIYGVDIDTQAVEVTKLSLLLKVLENENKDALEQQKKLIQERVLPYLGDNIKCGNSLIGTDILENNDLTQEEIKKINPFDWEEEFHTIMTNGGFDAIIGNPPYGTRTVLSTTEKKFIRKNNKITFSSGDSAEVFCKYSFSYLLKDNGIISFIIPKKSLYGESWESFRRDYLRKYGLKFLLDTSKSFKGVLLEIISFGLKKSINEMDNTNLAYVADLKIKNFSKSKKEDIFKENNTIQLYSILFSDIFKKISKNSYFNLISGKLGLAIGTKFYSNTPKKYKLLKGVDIDKWIVKNHRYLNNHDNIKIDKISPFLKPKIIAQRIIAHIENPYPHIKITACYDNEGIVITNTLTTFSFDERIDSKCLIALLNSRLFSFFAYNFIYSRAIRTMDFYDFYIKQMPFPQSLFEFKKKQNPFIDLTNKMIQLKKDLSNANNPHDKKLLEKQIEITDDKIDRLVYELYDLSREDIEIIENSLKE